MNIDLMIHILLAVCIVGLGICIVIVQLLTKEMNEVITKLYRKVDNLQHNEEVLMKNIQDLIAEKEKRNNPLAAKITEMLIESLKKRNSLNVVDSDKPLDFPNEH